jgi:DNA-directed RNA polymerase subunit RPC12/RpoP
VDTDMLIDIMCASLDNSAGMNVQCIDCGASFDVRIQNRKRSIRCSECRIVYDLNWQKTYKYKYKKKRCHVKADADLLGAPPYNPESELWTGYDYVICD